jgi:hypothetical protein
MPRCLETISPHKRRYLVTIAVASRYLSLESLLHGRAEANSAHRSFGNTVVRFRARSSEDAIGRKSGVGPLMAGLSRTSQSNGCCCVRHPINHLRPLSLTGAIHSQVLKQSVISITCIPFPFPSDPMTCPGMNPDPRTGLQPQLRDEGRRPGKRTRVQPDLWYWSLDHGHGRGLVQRSQPLGSKQRLMERYIS